MYANNQWLYSTNNVFQQEVDVPICLDCPKGVLDDDALIWLNGGGIPISLNYTNDRRYWLLTVLSGFYTQRDHFLLERKLAQLYRMAFIRYGFIVNILNVNIQIQFIPKIL